MKWYRTIFNKDPDIEALTEKTKKMPRNIYGSKDTKSHQKRFHFIHYFFKYKFFVPVLLLGRKLLKKYLVTKIPKGNHNRNMKIFDDSFEKSIKKWSLYYIRNSGPMEYRRTKRQMMKYYRNETYLRTLKEFANTMFVHDTAYREFLNILMHEITLNMVKYYKDHPDKKTGHLFFTTDIYEVNYYTLEKMVEYNIKLGVANSHELLEQAEKERNNRRKQKNGKQKNGKQNARK